MVRSDQGRLGRLGAPVLLLGTFGWAAGFGWGQAVPGAGSAPERKPCVATDGKADGSCVPAGAGVPGKDGAGKDGAPKADPSAAQRFPYPGEGSGGSPVAAAPDAPAKVDVPEVPAAPSGNRGSGGGASDPKPGAAGSFPYPGESVPDAASSSSGGLGSSSSSSSSSGPDGLGAAGAPGLDDVGSEGSTRTTRRKLPKPERIQSDEDRATEDLQVAKFYQQSGNLQAAYLRAKDAVKVQPADAETHFVLAAVLENLGRREEALAEFQAYLELDPDGEHVKAAQKAIGK